MKKIHTLLLAVIFASANAQQPFNILITDAEADAIIKGNYNPALYTTADASVDEIICAINAEVSPDTMKLYLEILSSYHNRNTYSDTISNNIGIGAARRWVFQKFSEYSSAANDRLIPAYVQYEMSAAEICGAGQFRNIIAVLPGIDTTDKSIIVIEGHMDSRCADNCDPFCLAQGMEDNGSGTVLVIELARVMSQFHFDRTIVFMVTVGEEQGLYGAYAMADYCDQNNIPVKAVQNNDVIGGIHCGESSSPPSCPFEGHVDSTHVRLFSYGTVNSKHKQYARYVKMTYHEKLLTLVNVPMQVMIMNPEDRSGRGGDHIPFRENGFTAIRFTSANEHGDANVADTSYHDRQHTSDDILGVDTDGDLIMDSFFVDFNYLARNTVINGVSSALTALAPVTPDFILTDNGQIVSITINDSMNYDHYRIFVRSSSNDFDAVYSVKDTNYSRIPSLISGTLYRISVASVNEDGVMSLFSAEQNINPLVNSSGSVDTVDFVAVNCISLGHIEIEKPQSNEQNELIIHPNPSSDKITLTFDFGNYSNQKKYYLEIHDIKGALLLRINWANQQGMNSIQLDVARFQSGSYDCLLLEENKIIEKAPFIVAR